MTTKVMEFKVDQMPRELARTEAMQQVQPDRYAPLRSVGQKLSMRGVAAAKVELVNGALLALVDMLFDADSDGVTPNVDQDGRILVPVPWGRAGGTAWGLRVTEQRTLNMIMRQRTQGDALFIYDQEARSWLLGRAYTTRRVAQAYLRMCPVTLGEWRAAWATVKTTWAKKHMRDE